MKPVHAMFAEERKRGRRKLILALLIVAVWIGVVAYGFLFIWLGDRILATRTPRSHAPAPPPWPDALTVDLCSNATLFVDGKLSTYEELLEAVSTAKGRVLLRVDESVPYKTTSVVLELISSGDGVSNITFSVRQAGQAPSPPTTRSP